MPEWSNSFPYFLQFKSGFGNKEFMILATVCSWSYFCWLYRASPSLVVKNICPILAPSLQPKIEGNIENTQMGNWREKVAYKGMDKVKGHLQGIMKHFRARNRNTARARSEETIGVSDLEMLKIVCAYRRNPSGAVPLVERPYQLDHSQARSEIRE